MSFPSFVFLISTGKMVFSSLNALVDPFEGYIPIRRFRKNIDRLLPARSGTRDKSDYLALYFAAKRHLFVNCWHVGRVESEAMWRLYGYEGGVAIRTDCGDPSALFGASSKGVIHRSVTYVDTHDAGDDMGVLDVPFLKRSAFRHENEYRFVIFNEAGFRKDAALLRVDEPIAENTWSFLKSAPNPVQLDFPMTKVITDVVTSPYAPDWHLEAACRVLSQFGLSVEARKSTLAAAPEY